MPVRHSDARTIVLNQVGIYLKCICLKEDSLVSLPLRSRYHFIHGAFGWLIGPRELQRRTSWLSIISNSIGTAATE